MNLVLASATIMLAVWAVVGPLVGIWYGQDLAREWQKRQWIAENRKQECRELLSVMASHWAAVNIVKSGMPTVRIQDRDRMNQASLAVMETLRSRIFLAPEATELKLAERWFSGPGSVNADNDQRQKTYDELMTAIRDRALDR